MTVTATPSPAQPAAGAEVQRRQRHQLVAVDHRALAVHRQHPVAVAVEGEADVVSPGAHALGERVHVSRAAAVVDVAAVGLDGDRLHVGAEAAEDLGRHAVGGAVGAVEQHADAVEVELAEAQLELAQVVAAGAVQLAHAADGSLWAAIAGGHELLDPGLLVVVELGAAGAEELDAVVLVGVVRGRHDGGQVEAVAAQQQRGAGRGQHAAEQRVASGGRHPGRQRGLEHLARLARVAHDQDLRRLCRRGGRGGPSERQRQLGGQLLARDTANAVGAEELGGLGHRRASAWRTAAACGPS